MRRLSSVGGARPSFRRSVVHLIGHLLAACATFVAFIFFAWLASIVFGWLDSIHHFPPEAFAFIERSELWLMYIDGILCCMVLCVGVYRFVKELCRG